MELKEFIKNSLIQIDKALDEASAEFDWYNYKYWPNSTWSKSIDFNIQVYVSDTATTNWETGINVAWLKLGASWESNNTNYNLSKLNFSVIRETPQKKSSPTKIGVEKYK